MTVTREVASSINQPFTEGVHNLNRYRPNYDRVEKRTQFKNLRFQPQINLNNDDFSRNLLTEESIDNLK